MGTITCPVCGTYLMASQTSTADMSSTNATSFQTIYQCQNEHIFQNQVARRASITELANRINAKQEYSKKFQAWQQQIRDRLEG